MIHKEKLNKTDKKKLNLYGYREKTLQFECGYKCLESVIR